MKRICAIIVLVLLAAMPLHLWAEETETAPAVTEEPAAEEAGDKAKEPPKKDKEKEKEKKPAEQPKEQPAAQPAPQPLIPLIPPPAEPAPAPAPAEPAAAPEPEAPAETPQPALVPLVAPAPAPAPAPAAAAEAPKPAAAQEPPAATPTEEAPAPVPLAVPVQPQPAPAAEPQTPAVEEAVPADTQPAPAPVAPVVAPAETPALQAPAETPAQPQPAPAPPAETPMVQPQPAPAPPAEAPVVEEAVPAAEQPAEAPPAEETAPAEPEGFTFSDPTYGSETPAPDVSAPVTNAILPGLRFEYGGTIRTRLGIDTSNEYVFVFDPLKKADDPDRASYTGMEDVVDWRTSLSFWTMLHFTPNLRARIGLYAEYGLTTRRQADGDATILVNGSHPRSTFKAEIQDAYLDWLDVAPGLDFRFGHQVVNFGMMDAHSVVERLSPTDASALLWSDLTVPRKPIWAVRMDYTYDWFKASVVWQPIFTGSDLDLYGSDFSVLQPGIPLDSQAAFPSPDVSSLLDPSKEHTDDLAFLTTENVMPYPQNSAAGVKLGVGISGFDAAVTYSFAYDELPRLAYDPQMLQLLGSLSDGNYALSAQILEGLRQRLNNGETVDDLFSSTYERTHTLGLLLGYGVWRFNFKTELSWEFAKGYWASDYRAVTHDTLSYAAGVDFTWEEMVYLSIEVFGSKLFDIQAGERLLYTTDANFGVFGLLRLAFFRETLKLELVAESRINTKELAVSPRIGYEVVEDLELILGAMFFECFDHEPAGFNRYNSNDDRKDSLFGRYSNNDQVYLMLKYSY